VHIWLVGSSFTSARHRYWVLKSHLCKRSRLPQIALFWSAFCSFKCTQWLGLAGSYCLLLFSRMQRQALEEGFWYILLLIMSSIWCLIGSRITQRLFSRYFQIRHYQWELKSIGSLKAKKGQISQILGRVFSITPFWHIFAFVCLDLLSSHF